MLDRMEGGDSMSKQRAATINVNYSELKVYVDKEGNRDAGSFHFNSTPLARHYCKASSPGFYTHTLHNSVHAR